MLIRIFLCFFLFTIQAKASISEANQFTKDVAANILKIVTQRKDIKLIRADLVSFIKANIDIKWTAKFVLGKNWRTASETEKSKFTKLFEEYLICTYAPKFEGYNSEKYLVRETSEIALNKYLSKLDFRLSDGTTILVELYILREKSSYKIVDIAAEGISFATTQRAEFDSVISKNGMNKFLSDLEQKMQKFEGCHPITKN